MKRYFRCTWSAGLPLQLGRRGNECSSTKPTLWVSIKLCATHSENERRVSAGRDTIHSFKSYFLVKIVKSTKPGADRGKFLVPHSEEDACTGSHHCKSGQPPLKSMDLHQGTIKIDSTEFTVTQIFLENFI